MEFTYWKGYEEALKQLTPEQLQKLVMSSLREMARREEKRRAA
jgi:hypothetical protein